MWQSRQPGADGRRGLQMRYMGWGGGGRAVGYAKHVMLLRPSALALRMVDFHVGVMVRAYNEED